MGSCGGCLHLRTGASGGQANRGFPAVGIPGCSHRGLVLLLETSHSSLFLGLFFQRRPSRRCPSNPGGPLRSDPNFLGKRGGLESGGSLFVLSENLSQRFSSGLSYQGSVRGDAEDELFGGGCPDRALAVSRDLLFSRQIIPDGSEKCPGFVDVRFYCLIR